MGECKRQLGDLAAAERLLFEGLLHHSAAGFGEVVLAALYVREIERLDAAESEQGPEYLRMNVPAEVAEPLDLTRDEVLRRAHYFAELACELDEHNPFAFEQRGLVAMYLADWVSAERSFAQALTLASARLYARLGLARCLEHRQLGAEAEAELRTATVGDSQNLVAHQELIAFLGRTDQPAQRLQALEAALVACEQDRDEFVRPLLDALRHDLPNEAACARLRECCEAHPDDVGLLWGAARALNDAGQRGHALALLRRTVELAPRAVEPLAMLGKMLSEDWLTREEGRSLLERAVELAPGWRYPRRSLAITCRDEPQRGLALLAPVLEQEDPYVYEVQAMLLAAQGDASAAERVTRRALAAFGREDVEALNMLCSWHVGEGRYEAGIQHARRLMQLSVPEDQEMDIHDTILSAFRLGGRMREIHDWIRARCPGNAPPPELAFDVYYGLDPLDRPLAAEAARVLAERAEASGEVDDALEWRVNEARLRALLGNLQPLTQLRETMAERADGWARLAWAYASLHDYHSANHCAERAFAIAPERADSLTVMLETHDRRGDHEAAFRCAQRLYELFPYEHRGPERLAELHAKRLDVEAALAHSAHAADAAPFCHIAVTSRALALFVAGDYQEAARHAERALMLDEPDEPDAAKDALWVLRAIQRDQAGLERCLATARARLGRLPSEPFVALLRTVASRQVAD